MDGGKSYTFHNEGAALDGSGPSGQNGSHPPPLGRTATSGALGESFAAQMSYYREKVPRRRRKRCHGCLSLSGYSWTFLFLALIQGELQGRRVL